MGNGAPGHKKGASKAKGITKKWKTKRYKRDIDQVYDDLNTTVIAEKLLNQAVDPDLPGFGQNYCIECAMLRRHFVTEEVLLKHRTSKLHKRRVKELREEPHRGPAIKIDNGKPIVRDE